MSDCSCSSKSILAFHVIVFPAPSTILEPTSPVTVLVGTAQVDPPSSDISISIVDQLSSSKL